METIVTGDADPEIVELGAVLRRAQLDADVAGTRVSGTFRHTRVWTREHGGPWRIVAGHVSAVSPSE